MKIKIEYEPVHDERGDYIGDIETEASWDRRMEETYRPHEEKPWRVTWGFGAFEDFSTEEEAWKCYRGINANLNPQEPFDVIEVWSKR